MHEFGAETSEWDGDEASLHSLAIRPCSECLFELAGLPDTARYCPQCGHDLTPAAQPSGGAPLVRAFARALYHLGVRYEAALNIRANRHEAIRCYQKAAKLGDTGAAERLAANRKEIESRPVLPIET